MANELYVVKVGGTNGRGNYSECDLHFDCGNVSGDGPYDEAKAILVWFIANIIPAIKAVMGNDVKLDVLHCRRVRPVGATTAISVIAEAGTATSGTVSEVLACCVQLVMNTIPRPGHVYWFGMPDGAVVGDHLDTVTYLPNIQTLMSLLALGGALANGDVVALAVFHRATLNWTTPVIPNVLDKVTGMNRRTRPLV